jgi:hypothetical protein
MQVLHLTQEPLTDPVQDLVHQEFVKVLAVSIFSQYPKQHRLIPLFRTQAHVESGSVVDIMFRWRQILSIAGLQS